MSERGLRRALTILTCMEKYSEHGFDVVERRFIQEVLEYVVHDGTGEDGPMIH